MNKILKSKEIFQLKNLVPYESEKIVDLDLVNNDKMRLVLMSFDKGTVLSEHKAPSNAIFTAIEGEGVINYEGTDYPIKCGESFKFDKGGSHSVTAISQFKIILLIIY